MLGHCFDANGFKIENQNLFDCDGVRLEITELKTSDDAVEYFKQNIWNNWFLNQRGVLKALTSRELKLLYYKIIGIEIISKRTTKSEIVYNIVEYINSEIRICDLAKGLF